MVRGESNILSEAQTALVLAKGNEKKPSYMGHNSRIYLSIGTKVYYLY